MKKQSNIEKLTNYVTLLVLLLYTVNGISNIKEQVVPFYKELPHNHVEDDLEIKLTRKR